TPLRMEFWHDGEFRLHDRFVFSRTDSGSAWACQRLSP
ncbi:MAG TPA: pyridoxamine 5'-phosphate oxidase, partial [Hyphomonadaceae bacterium]|nr:pyridoxamine 5'-phosphate oxidase [Hyphomonadaceae bacterium]